MTLIYLGKSLRRNVNGFGALGDTGVSEVLKSYSLANCPLDRGHYHRNVYAISGGFLCILQYLLLTAILRELLLVDRCVHESI